ncbi:MAG: formyltransferase family protein [Spirosomataceae bacterium]
MSIGVLSNGKISIPLIQALTQHRLLAWVAISDEKNESVAELIAYLDNYRVPYFLMKKEDFVAVLLQKIKQMNVFSLFVLGFTWKLPTDLLGVPMLGCWNFHFGALPAYRGNAPIFWQIKHQEKVASLTVHKITKHLDEGAIAHVESTPILIHDTFGTIEKKLSLLAVNAMMILIEKLFSNKLSLSEQNHKHAKVYKKPTATDVCIDWQKQTAKEIRSLICATNPWNKGAYTQFQQQYIRFLQVEILNDSEKNQEKAGTIIKADSEGLWVICKDKSVLNIEIVYSDEGYFTGAQLVKLGVTKGQRFE